MSDELKACPFCGETLRINNARLAVHSRNSECLLRQQPIVVDDKDQVERWNTRATHPAAASVGGGEAVAWLTSDKRHLVFRGALDQSQYVEQGMTPLYTHPADQVVDDLTMVKVSRELLERLYTSNSKYQFDPKTYWPAHEELRALLAKSEGEK